MTDEERQKLIEDLRDLRRYEGSYQTLSIIEKAASEIERLARENKKRQITPLGIESAAHAIRLVEDNEISLEECRILAKAALCGAFP